MSTYYYLACHTCKKKTRIGQSNVFYSKEPRTIENIGLFLISHFNKPKHEIAILSDSEWGGDKTEDNYEVFSIVRSVAEATEPQPPRECAIVSAQSEAQSEASQGLL